MAYIRGFTVVLHEKHVTLLVAHGHCTVGLIFAVKFIISDHWFRQWLITCPVPSRCLNKYWLIVNWTLRYKFQWYLNLTIMVFTEKMHLKMSSVIWQPFYSWLIVLTLNVRGPSYLGLTRSISWLLMPWLLTSPEHQQPWYWLCRIGRFLSYLRKDFNYLCRINLEKRHKI